MTSTEQPVAAPGGVLPFDDELAVLSTRFIEAASADLDTVAADALAGLGARLDADRVALYRLDFETRVAHTVQEWTSQGSTVAPSIGMIEMDAVPSLTQLVESGRATVLQRTDERLGEQERALLERCGVESGLVVPVVVGGTLQAVLIASTVGDRREWGDAQVRHATMVALMIGGARKRREAVTGQLRTEAALRESEARFGTFVENAPNAMVVLDVERQCYAEANAAAEALFGRSREELRSLCPADVSPELQYDGQPSAPLIPGIIQRAMTGELHRFRWTHQHVDGHAVPCEIRMVQLPSADRTLLLANITDISARLAMEQELTDSSERFQALTEAAFEGVVITTKGVVVWTNEAFGNMFGYTDEEVIGMTPFAVTTPEGGAECLRNIKSGRTDPYVITGVRKDGTQFPLEIHGRECTYEGQLARVTGFRDLSEKVRSREEREQLERQLRLTQKLESLGVLAGGIAHDFNNLLAAMLGNAELAKTTVAPGSPTHEFVHRIEIAAQRAAGLTEQMLAYSGQGRFRSEWTDLNELVTEISDLLEVSLSKKASLVLALDPALPGVSGDPSQLRQVVLNLITNASEAVGSAIGHVTLRTRIQQVGVDDFAGTPFHETVAPGEHVVLEVSDTGTGMDAETVDRIFDPFFSTKFVGRGLGLAVVLGIIRRHEGAVRVWSRPGGGSRFEVYLPSAGFSTSPEVVETKRDPSRLEGTVLVVDDEPLVREIAQSLLEHLGVRVITAKDGVEGVERVRVQAAEIDVVLLDLTMPRMDGVEAFSVIRSLAPDLPVVLTSGFHGSELPPEVVSGGIEAFLRKPFTSDALHGVLRPLLGP